MVYSGKHFAEAFRTVRKNTLQIAEEIPEDKYSFKATPDVMTVGEDLAHLAAFTRWPQTVHGAQRKPAFVFGEFQGLMDDMMKFQGSLKTKAQIVEALRTEGDSFAAFLEGLSDDLLSEMVSFPPEAQQGAKSRFEMLLGVKEHEMHHRAKLMVAQRLLGMVPHLTRRRQEMMAARAAAAPAGAGAGAAARPN
jgi:uncharacterized damage-inducible protein DinB